MSTTMTDSSSSSSSGAAAAAAAIAPPHKKRKREERNKEGEAAAAQEAATSAAAVSTIAAPAGSSKFAPLLTARGGEAIRQALATQHPAPFIQQFQAEHGLRAPALECSLSFLDLFVPKRAGIYMSLLSELNEKLTDNIRTGHVDKDKIPLLLESTFAYISVDELRSIPIALLMSLLSSTGSIPTKYLKPLVSSTSKLIESLPLQLRRCLMEAEPEKLFWQHAHWTGLMKAYANDGARIDAYNQLLPLEQMALACKKVRKDGPNGSSSGAAAAASSASPSANALRGMLEWIGSSTRLYDYTCTHLRELVMGAERSGRHSEAQLWRSMRVDLLMRLHETDQESKVHASSSSSSSSSGHKSHLASHIDHLHTWVWCLDAGVRDQGHLSQKLLDKLIGGEGVAGFLTTLKPKHISRFTLSDLSMLASHPAIVLTLLHSIIAALAESVEKEITPKEHTQLKPLTNILHLALSPLAPLIQPDAPTSPLHLPEPDNAEALYTEFYPFVAELIIYAQLGEMEPLNAKLLEYVETSAVARSVFLFYLLSRLQQQDLLQSAALLSCLPNIQLQGTSLWSVETGQGDQHLLDGILQTAVTLIIAIKHVLKTDHAFRTAVFPSCFLLLARVSPFAHKQCLRLLAACVDCLTLEEMSSYLAQVQREGVRGESPNVAAAAAPTSEQPAAAAVSDLAPVCNLPAQIASLYQQLQPKKQKA